MDQGAVPSRGYAPTSVTSGWKSQLAWFGVDVGALHTVWTSLGQDVDGSLRLSGIALRVTVGPVPPSRV
jgi:hypothetical protein